MTSKEYNKSVEEFSDNVFRFLLSNISDKNRAHDIVQDTFEKLWIKRKNVDYAKVKSYLFSTAYHTMIDIIRREKRISELDSDRMKDMKYEDEYSDIQEILHKAINKLPEDQRSVILLRDYEGYSYKEISEITELSEAQVKVYIYRARKFLKDYLVKVELVI